jgi:hypothetical protein
MIDRVPATAGRPALQAAKLIDRASIVEQPHRFRVNEWQRGQVELRAIEFAVTVTDAVPVERCRAPLRSIRVPHGLLDAVASEQFDEFRHDGLRIERHSRIASTTTTSLSMCPIAHVMASDDPPEGSVKLKYRMRADFKLLELQTAIGIELPVFV